MNDIDLRDYVEAMLSERDKRWKLLFKEREKQVALALAASDLTGLRERVAALERMQFRILGAVAVVAILIPLAVHFVK